MVHNYLQNASNRIFVYRRRYMKDGMYYQKTLSPVQIVEGDHFKPMQASDVLLKVVNIISREDSKARGFTDEEKVGAIQELELYDENYTNDNNYKPVYNI